MNRRALIYSHDTFGIGNIRRTLELCRALSRRLPDLSILIITGSPKVDAFRIPSNVDYVKLPALKRANRGEYHARAQGFNSPNLVKMRAEICLAAAERFDPDIVIVDKAPFGVGRELAPALERLGESRPDCVRILALRDILDASDAVREAWRRESIGDAIADHYDAVWVFGSPNFFDVAREYDLPATLVAKLSYLGWIGRFDPPIPAAKARRELDFDGGPFVLVTAGGGEDGDHLLGSFARTLDQLERVEPGIQTLLISGPLASSRLRDLIAASCRGRRRRRSLEFAPDLTSLINAADAVVSMCGYNTTCEILSLHKPALVVPRNHPVQEQLVRARRLSELGAVRMCPPEELTEERLISEIQLLLHDFAPTILDHERFPFTGLELASSMVDRFLSSPVAAAAAAARAAGSARMSRDSESNEYAHPVPRFK